MSTVAKPAPEIIVPKVTKREQARVLRLVEHRTPITQDNLRALRRAQEKVEEAARIYKVELARFKELEQSIALRAVAGAPIRRGVWKPRISLRNIRHPRYKDALISAKGEAYQQRVLDETKPVIHYYGHVD